MIKYRRLDGKELESLEQDFVSFLASNSIQAQDWQKLKSDSPAKVDELMDVFSDTVLEKVYTKAKHLIIVKPNELHAFRMEESFATLIGVRFNAPNLNLLNRNELEMIFNSENSFISHQPKLFSLDKKYDKPKPEEVFFLIKQGAVLVDKKWFEFLQSLNTKQ
jgi:cag pathogenicity island protein 24